ncbi:hypothetical protein MKW94_015376 [Papaver nudicaule]|uniref:Uncharacterized protein n=1 Tax=Papaver nudicaule TaxID=74823 RepID=A0AA41UZQ6_PAPNU|nr:hypothetical protein [Papaver nudicaule]
MSNEVRNHTGAKLGLSYRLSKKPNYLDHYELIPDDEATETILRQYMNSAYVTYRASLSNYFRETCKRDLQFALANPPENCENIEDWKEICEYFNTPAARARSDKAIAAREKQVLNHTNGSQSFTRKLFDMKEKGQAVDPVTMFKETHKKKKAELQPICEQWMKDLDDLVEQKERGEIDCSLEEIYHQVVDTTKLGRKRRQKKAALPANYSKNDEKLTAVQEQLDAANKRIATLVKLVNVAFKNLGQAPLPEDSEPEFEQPQLEDPSDGFSEEEDEEMMNGEENMDAGQFGHDDFEDEMEA